MNTRQVSRLQLFVFVIATATILVACISQALIPSDAPPMDPLSMVDVFHQTINGDDMDALLVLFSDDAVVIDNGLVIESKELIRDWAIHSQRMAGLRLTMLKSELDGEKVIWLDEAHKDQETGHGSYLLKWEAIIRDGKIQSLAAMPRYWPDLK
jgi:hypothetical protein